MSFYFDDEPQSQSQTKESQQAAGGGTTGDDDDEAFVCVNCGSTTYYVESSTGALCCDSCFTQSQQMTADSTELDMAEVQALAARTKSGRVVKSTSINRRRGGMGSFYVPQQKKPLEEYDTSTPFPNLITCLHGIQQVMKHCVGPLCDLVELSSSSSVAVVETSSRGVVEETVRKLWMSYLRAWADGAEFYGQLHPEIRFSMRDYFLPRPYKVKVMQHLSHRALQVVRDELDAEDEEGEEKKEEEAAWTADKRRSKNESDSDDDDDDNNQDYSGLTKSHQHSIRHFSASYHHPTSLMCMYWHNGKRGRLEAALVTTPSMNLVACLLWLAVSRAGVSLNHVLQWIANGALPLQNAFVHCLSQKERQALHHVSSFFRMTKLPTMTEMENLANRLVVACGLKSFAHLHGIRQPRTPNAIMHRPDSAAAVDNLDRPDFSYVTPVSVPLLTARLVIQDLGFDRQILDRSLALMGILKEAPPNVWHPGPLRGAHPTNLATTADVLSVIAVACRMTPGWETWAYPGPMATTNEEEDDLNDVVIDIQERQRVAKRRRVEAASRRFVPYNEEHIRLLRNGPLVEGYIDYLEEHFLNDKEGIFPRFRSTLESSSRAQTTKASSAVGKEGIVRKHSLTRESCNPFGPKRIWRRQKSHDWKLKLKRKRARWADANGLGEYVIYSDPDTHAKDTRRVGKNKRIPIPEPFHPQYGLLLEYMSYKTNVRPSDIHAAVVVLDDEVLRLVRPREEVKLIRRVPRKRRASQDLVSANAVPSNEATIVNERNPDSDETKIGEEGNNDQVRSSSFASI